MRTGAGPAYSGYSVILPESSDHRDLAKAVGGLLPDSLRATTWEDRNPSLTASMQLEKIGSFAAILLITLVASFNILGTVARSVVERRSDIAILKAIGAGRGLILRVFLWEGLLVGLAGVGFGLVLGLGGCIVLSGTDLITLPDVYSFHEHLPVRVNITDVAAVALAALAISTASAFVPARRAALLDPVDGLEGA